MLLGALLAVFSDLMACSIFFSHFFNESVKPLLLFLQCIVHWTSLTRQRWLLNWQMYAVNDVLRSLAMKSM